MSFPLPPIAAMLTPNTLGAVFAASAAAFAGLSWVLTYHWSRYGYNQAVIGRMRALYFGGALLWFGLMVVGILLFTP